LLEMIQLASYRVFDVNLRPPHYTFETLQMLLKEAHLVKCNEEELDALTNKGDSGDMKTQMRSLTSQFGIETLCVTLGDKGAIVLHEDVYYQHIGFPVEVADTVGAGDSFLAAFLNYFLKDRNVDIALEKACAMGALVASKSGANPEVTEEEVIGFINSNRTDS